MDDTSIRLACLKLARPDGITNPDAQAIIDRAGKFVAFVKMVTPADIVGPAVKRNTADTAQAPAKAK